MFLRAACTGQVLSQACRQGSRPCVTAIGEIRRLTMVSLNGMMPKIVGTLVLATVAGVVHSSA